MSVDDFAKALGIDKEVEQENGQFVINLSNSNEYAKMYTLLSQSDIVDLVSESVVINEDITSLMYEGNYHTVTLSADLDRNIYKLVFEEVM